MNKKKQSQMNYFLPLFKKSELIIFLQVFEMNISEIQNLKNTLFQKDPKIKLYQIKNTILSELIPKNIMSLFFQGPIIIGLFDPSFDLNLIHKEKSIGHLETVNFLINYFNSELKNSKGIILCAKSGDNLLNFEELKIIQQNEGLIKNTHTKLLSTLQMTKLFS